MGMTMQKWLTVAVRIVFGGVFVMAGASKLLPVQAPPPDLPPAAMAFVSGLAGTGYFMPLLAIVEVLAGLALLSNRFVPLALVLLAPVVVHIALFHAVLAPAYGLAALVVGAEGWLAWTERDAFAPLLTPQRRPEAARRPTTDRTRLAA
jgi:putative oxidoreductase